MATELLFKLFSFCFSELPNVILIPLKDCTGKPRAECTIERMVLCCEAWRKTPHKMENIQLHLNFPEMEQHMGRGLSRYIAAISIHVYDIGLWHISFNQPPLL